MKKGFLKILGSLLLMSSLHSHSANAEGPEYATSRMEVEMVVDVSRSMLSSDPNKISNEAMKMFVDMSSTKGDKIGVIAYGNSVIAKKDIVKIQSQQDKQTIKTFIDSLQYAPNTDMSTGLAEALKALESGHEKEYEPLIVLLADGNNDPDKTKGKSAQQADEQTAIAVSEAKSKGYPIYVIGLNADGKLNKNLLKNIAVNTSGKYFETSNANDLPGILSEIFADHLKLKIVPIKDVVATEQFQEIPLTIPNENVLEANISLVSSKPVEVKLVDPAGKEQTIPSDTISLNRSKNYSMLKLLNPSQGNWKLMVKGSPKDKIDIKLVFNNDLQLMLAPLSKKSYFKGEQVTLTSFFQDNGKPITNEDLYKSLKSTLFVKDVDSGNMEEIPLTGTENGFTGEFTVGDASSYEVMMKAEGNSFYRETAVMTIPVTVAAAAKPKEEAVKVAKEKERPEAPSWLYLVLLAAGIVLIISYLFARVLKKKKENRGFFGQIVIGIRDGSTGEWHHPQMKKLKGFKGEFFLNQLFPLDLDYKELEKISFIPITDNTLLLINKSNCTIEIDGTSIDACTGHRLRRNDKLEIFINQSNKSLYVENAS